MAIPFSSFTYEHEHEYEIHRIDDQRTNGGEEYMFVAIEPGTLRRQCKFRCGSRGVICINSFISFSG